MSMPSDGPGTWASVWLGRYTDGKTAQSVPAEVRIGDRGLEIGFPGAPQALVWPFGALGAGTPVTRNADDVLLTYKFMPGATLFVPDPAFVRRIVKIAPQITAASFGWCAARPWIYAAAGVAVVVAGIWAVDLSPSRALARMMPDSVRKTVGEQVVASISSGRRVCETPRGRAALDKLVTRLAQATGTTTRFDVKAIDWSLLNAFAAPGGQIMLTREIVGQAKSADEIAGVLAH